MNAARSLVSSLFSCSSSRSRLQRSAPSQRRPDRRRQPRRRALGPQGGQPSVSPRIDRLTAEGLRFERAIAPASWNLPSLSSLVTSTYPWVHGQGASGSGEADLATLAEAFSGAGYRTGAFTEVDWPLLGRGFDALREHRRLRRARRSPEQCGEDPRSRLAWVHRTTSDRSSCWCTPRGPQLLPGQTRPPRLRPTRAARIPGPVPRVGIRDLAKPGGPTGDRRPAEGRRGRRRLPARALPRCGGGARCGGW